LEAVEIDEHQRSLRAVALHMGQRPLELTLESAAVEDVEQRIDVGTGLELADARAGDRKFAFQPLGFGQQRGDRWKLVGEAWLRKAHMCFSLSVLANLNPAPKNTPFALPVGGPDL